jgi:hypothetical protein
MFLLNMLELLDSLSIKKTTLLAFILLIILFNSLINSSFEFAKTVFVTLKKVGQYFSSALAPL